MFCNAILFTASVNCNPVMQSSLLHLWLFSTVWFPYAINVFASLFSFQKKRSSLQASFLACYQIHWESTWNSCVTTLLHQCLCFMALSVSFKVSSCWNYKQQAQMVRIACLILLLTLNCQQCTVLSCWAYCTKQALLLKRPVNYIPKSY